LYPWLARAVNCSGVITLTFEKTGLHKAANRTAGILPPSSADMVLRQV